MKFTIHRDPLLEALQKVQSVVEKRNTIQILGNILCVVKGNDLSLCGTDLEVGVKVTLPVEGAQEGKITLSAKHFLDIVKELFAVGPGLTCKLRRRHGQRARLVHPEQMSEWVRVDALSSLTLRPSAQPNDSSTSFN